MNEQHLSLTPEAIERIANAPLTDDFAAIAPRITSGLSTISSFLIIYLIIRSNDKLSTIYHRIMFAMSCADILGSIAMGLTTLPMPREQPWDRYEYHWSGTRLGNMLTCRAQGALFVFGTACMFLYNASLCIYYTCAIAFKMKEKKIIKYVEPFLHLIPLIVAFYWTISAFIVNAYGATGYEAWCTVSASNYDLEAELAIKKEVESSFKFAFIIGFFLILLCFLLIVCSVIKTERELKPLTGIVQGRKGHRQKKTSQNIPKLYRVTESHRNTKVILVQALAYIVSFSISLGTPLLRSLIMYEGPWIIRLQIVLMPLQGFFNATIFIYHKIYNYRRVHKDVSRCDVLRLMFSEVYLEPVVLSRVSMVRQDNDNDREQIHIQLEDEKNGEPLEFDMESTKSDGLKVHFADDEGRDSLNDFLSYDKESNKSESRFMDNLSEGSKGEDETGLNSNSDRHSIGAISHSKASAVSSLSASYLS